MSACATPQQRAARLSSPTLCYVNYAGDGNDKAVTSAELARRGFTCKPEDVAWGAQEWAQLKQRQQAAASDAAAAAALWAATRPQAPAAPAPPINCVSNRSGNTVYTNCY